MKIFDVILVTDTPEYPKWFRGNGAHRLASHLRSYNFSCLVLDFSSALDFDTWKSICKQSIGSNTKMVGFSTTWWPYRSVKMKKIVTDLKKFNDEDYSDNQLSNVSLTRAAVEGTLDIWIDEIKKINKKTKIVVGGPKIDFYRDIPADNFIVGFGETQTIDYLKENLRLWPKFINHDKNAVNKVFDFRCSQTLYTEYDLMGPEDILTIEFTRGCKFKCSFCSYPLIGRKNVVEESLKYPDTIYREFIDNYEKWGTTKYWVADDTFNDSTEKLEEILKIVKKLPFQPKFRAYTRLDVMDYNFSQATLLKEIGLVNSWMGIDSFHPEASKMIGKGMNAGKKKDLLYRIKEVWKNDVSIDAGYIAGLPKEDSDYLNSVIEWYLEPGNPLDSLYLNSLRINPIESGLENTNRSDIDLNYVKYGYRIPNFQKFWEWFKEDGTDLTSFSITSELCDTINEKTSKKKYREKNPYTSRIVDPKTEYFEKLIEKLKK